MLDGAARVEQRHRRATAPGARARAHRAVVVGYGPDRPHRRRGCCEKRDRADGDRIELDTVRELRPQGIDAVYGDATRPETLTAAGVADAGTLILTSAGMANSSEVIRPPAS